MSRVKKFRKLTSFTSNLKNSAFIIFRHNGSSTDIQFQFAREITITIYLRWNNNKEAQNYTVLLRKLLYWFIPVYCLGCLTVSIILGSVCVCVFLELVSDTEIISFYIMNSIWNKNYYDSFVLPKTNRVYHFIDIGLFIWTLQIVWCKVRGMDWKEETQIPRKTFHFSDSSLSFEKWGNCTDLVSSHSFSEDKITCNVFEMYEPLPKCE